MSLVPEGDRPLGADSMNAAFDVFEAFQDREVRGRPYTGDDLAEAASAYERLEGSLDLSAEARSVFFQRIERYFPPEGHEADDRSFLHIARAGALVALMAARAEEAAEVEEAPTIKAKAIRDAIEQCLADRARLHLVEGVEEDQLLKRQLEPLGLTPAVVEELVALVEERCHPAGPSTAVAFALVAGLTAAQDRT